MEMLVESRSEEVVKRRPAPCKKRGRPEVLATGADAVEATRPHHQAGNGSNKQQASPCDRSPAQPSSSSTSFPRRCARLVKEQRARLYIVRRCVTMLACWRDYP